MSQGRMVLLAALALFISCSFNAVVAAPPVLDDPVIDQRSCGTDESGPMVVAPDMATIEKWVRENRIAAAGVIPVNFHVIYSSNGEGNVAESQLDAQITVLNRNFAGQDYDGNPVPGADNTGYTFYKASVTRTKSSKWFKMTPGSSAERNAKNSLAVAWTSSLNLYTCKPGQNLLGWAVFPWTSSANTRQDGVVIHYGSLPGGYLSPFDLGGTATHEVGHWVGCYHTFQGGCHSDATCGTAGDLVCDTPAQGTATSGCPNGKDTCASSAGADPIHNYMDYSDDACYNQFTAGQDTRMDWAMSTYRPAIGSAKMTPDGPIAAKSEPAMLVSPNPFNPTTAIEFAVPRDGHVSLRVYDVAGCNVATLVDGVRAAGSHRAVFGGDGLSSGVYLAVLRAGGIERTQRLVLMK